mmetsp:Transcript_34856/g.81442  ORF Transcript_34856/g.81442 Transcript_34856/m.81442 type:complete len:382 (+) Transcript_34856:92-1237(+)
MGGLLDKPVTEKTIETGDSSRMQWVAIAMQGWRPEMEDEHIAIADLGDELAGVGLYCVFDGHGGRAVSAFVKQHFAKEFVRLTSEVGRTKFGKNKAKKRQCGVLIEASEYEAILKNTFHEMDVIIRDPANAQTLSRLVGKVPGGAIEDLKKQLNAVQAKQQKGGLSAEDQVTMKEAVTKLHKYEQADKGEDFVADNVGCTSVCVMVRQKDIVCANAGDSRAVLCRNGKAEPLSFDHKPEDETEKTRIEKAGGYLDTKNGGARVNGNLNLSRSLGDLEYKKNTELGPEEQIICSTPDVIVKELLPEDEFIVLACDGVWDVVSNQEACDFVRPKLLEKQDLSSIATALLDHCLSSDPRQTDGLGTDNMTAVIVKLTESSTWTS